MASVTPIRSGKKQIGLWIEDDVYESYSKFCEQAGTSNSEMARLACDLFRRLTVEMVREVQRLAVIERIDPAEVLARMLRRGFDVETGAADQTPREGVSMTADQLRRLEALEAECVTLKAQVAEHEKRLGKRR